MRIRTQITDSDISAAFKTYIERRLRFALSRFADRIGMISIRLKANGSTGHRCRISAEILPAGHVTVTESDVDLFAAIDRASGKLGQQFARAIERMRDAKVCRQSIRLAA